jgi:hypothetical protein
MHQLKILLQAFKKKAENRIVKNIAALPGFYICSGEFFIHQLIKPGQGVFW